MSAHDYSPKNPKYRRLLNESELQNGRSLYSDAWDRLKKDKAAMVSLVLIGLFVLIAIFAPMLPALDPEAIESRREVNGEIVLPPYPPSLKNIMGSDQLGRNIFSRVIYGVRVSLLVGVVARGLTMLLGVTLGVISAYYGGWIDTIIMRITDIFLAFPVMLLAMVITLILKPSLTTVCIAIMLVGWPDVTRLIRGQAIKLKSKDYVRASRVLGARDGWIIVKQILPNCLSLIIVSFSMGVPGAIMYEAGMSFFGYGIQAPIPSLGNMIADARGYMTVCPWYILFPGLALVLIVVAFNIFGDGLNDALDPYAKRRS